MPSKNNKLYISLELKKYQDRSIRDVGAVPFKSSQKNDYIKLSCVLKFIRIYL